MKKIAKRLALSREVVRSLASFELSNVDGGISSDTRRGTVCMQGCGGGGSGGVTCTGDGDCVTGVVSECRC